MIVGILQEQGVWCGPFDVKRFDESADLVTAGNLLLVFCSRVGTLQEKAVLAYLVYPFGILFPYPIIEAGVCIIIDFGVGDELNVEGIAGDLKLMLGIVQEGIGILYLIFIPDTLHKDLPFSLNIREPLAGSHYAEYQQNAREDPEKWKVFTHKLFQAANHIFWLYPLVKLLAGQ